MEYFGQNLSAGAQFCEQAPHSCHVVHIPSTGNSSQSHVKNYILSSKQQFPLEEGRCCLYRGWFFTGSAPKCKASHASDRTMYLKNYTKFYDRFLQSDIMYTVLYNCTLHYAFQEKRGPKMCNFELQFFPRIFIKKL